MTGAFNSAKSALERHGASGRADLHRAKAMRARTRGSNPTALGSYTAEEAKQLGEQDPPKALKLADGTWGYVIKSLVDLTDALAAYKNSDGDKTGVRAWIIQRATLLGLVEQLPKAGQRPR